MKDALDGCAIDFARHAQSDRRNQELLADLAREARQARTLAAVSSAGRDLDLAARLRRDGLKVIEVGGWQTRGHATLNPKGAVTHHTAGAAASPTRRAPSLGIIINGRSDLAGPLANTYIDYDGNVYVIASGKANHAGIPDAGAMPWASGNSSAWGLEVEHPGTFPLPANIAEIAARVQAATVRGTVGADRVVYHKEWAPSRKIDLATAPSPAEHRRQVAAFLAGSNPPEEDEMQSWVIPGAKWYIRDRRPETKPEGMPSRPFDNPDFKTVVAFFAETHRAMGPPAAYQTWRDERILGTPPNTPIPNLPLDRWWPGINADLDFAKRYADKADDPLQAEFAAKVAEVAALQAALEEARRNGDSHVAELEAKIAKALEALA